MANLICQTVTAATMAELRARRDAVVAADLVELRLDGVTDPDVRGALAGRRLPVIVTCRPTWEGGRFDGSEEERSRILGQAVEAGADYIDVEWRAGFRELLMRTAGRGVVLSVHDFSGVPSDLPSLHRSMRGTGAEVVKIAVTARRLCDAFALDALAGSVGGRVTARSGARDPALSGLDVRGGESPGTVFIAMGPSGLATRILPNRFGSRWTYAGDCAPGQIAADRLVRELRFREVSASTAVYGVAGAHAADSLSPALHNAAFRAGGVDAVYLPLQTDDFDDVLAFADRLPMTGLSVTMPFKGTALRRSDEVDDIARAAGAVNTLRRTAAGWCGTNTDVDGFLDPIRDVSLRGRRVAILGAGGAARAVAVAVGRAGARVSVFARNRERAVEVAALAQGEAFSGLPDAASWDVLINATPVGSAPDVARTPVDGVGLGGDARLEAETRPHGGGRERAGCRERIVYDLVYRPAVTRLLREAQAAGCRTVGGLEMLIAQARRQSAWWTGRLPEERVMREALGTAADEAGEGAGPGRDKP